jgi:hypothetical protein
MPGCAPEERALFLRAFGPLDGAAAWDATVHPGGAVQASLVHWGLVRQPVAGAITLSQALLEGEQRGILQAFGLGSRLFSCPIEGELQIRAATFEGSFAYLLVERGDQWRLEVYRLDGLSFRSDGWPQPGGLFGTRRAIP